MFSPGTFFPLLFSFWNLSSERMDLNQYGNFYAYISDFSPTLHSSDLDESGRTNIRNQLQEKFPEFSPIPCNSEGIGVYVRKECHSLSRPLKAILIVMNDLPSPLALKHLHRTTKVQTRGRDFAGVFMIPKITSDQTHGKPADKYDWQ